MSEWDAAADFMTAIDAAKDRLSLREHEECFFRGHSDTRYRLLPSLYRQGEKTDEEYQKLERRSFFEFRTLARQLYERNYSDWDVLFHMQHHRVPTRLLDWTSVLGVALYFALLNYRDDEERVACVWLLNPYALNDATWQVRRLFNPKYLARDERVNRSYDFGELLLGARPTQPEWQPWYTPMAISDHQKSERMFAQTGWFTIHGTDRRGMEEILEGRDNILRKVDVPKSAVTGLRKFLVYAGIGHRQMFPGLDGLARTVCEKYGITR